MLRRTEAVVAAERSDGAAGHAVPAVPPPTGRSRPAGALDALLDTGPGFPVVLRGYDRLHVDNYVAWVELELRSARREADDLMSRYGRCAAELEISRRLLAQSAEAQQLTQMSERIGTMLRVAADEAAARTAAAGAEADRILADARLDADARLQKAHEIKELAIAASDRIREQAARMRNAAEAELEEAHRRAAAVVDCARAEAEELLRGVERARRESEEANARATAALQAEVEDLHRQRARARESLARLTAQIDEALSALAATPAGNVAVLAAPASGEVAVLAELTDG